MQDAHVLQVAVVLLAAVLFYTWLARCLRESPPVVLLLAVRSAAHACGATANIASTPRPRRPPSVPALPVAVAAGLIEQDAGTVWAQARARVVAARAAASRRWTGTGVALNAAVPGPVLRRVAVAASRRSPSTARAPRTTATSSPDSCPPCPSRASASCATRPGAWPTPPSAAVTGERRSRAPAAVIPSRVAQGAGDP